MAEGMERSGEVWKRGREGEGVFTWPLISILEAFHMQIKPSTIVQPFEKGCVCVSVRVFSDSSIKDKPFKQASTARAHRLN